MIKVLKKACNVYLILLLCYCILMTSLFFIDKANENKVFQGIYVEDLYVGGLSREEAKVKLSEHLKDSIQKPIVLVYNEKKWSINPAENILIDVDKTIDDAVKYKKSNFFLKNFATGRKLKQNPVKLPIVVKLREEKLSVIQEIIDFIYKEPKNATFKIIDDKVTIEKSINGIQLDEEKLKQALIKTVLKKDRILNLKVKEIKPDITEEELQKMNINVKIAEYQTNFDITQRQRVENIKLASGKLKGLILAPGEVFSFNNSVGERTIKLGYKEAPIFINNKAVPGVGGGVCQVSSTIYNLALLTDLEILERTNHSMPVSYVPLGQDATVNYNVIDLKFKNNTGGFLLLDTEVKGNSLIAKFFGPEKPNKTVKIVSEKVKTISPSVVEKKDYNMKKDDVKFDYGRPGYVVKVWKIVNSNGTQQKKLISTDRYNPTTTIKYIGVKEVKEKPGDTTVKPIKPGEPTNQESSTNSEKITEIDSTEPKNPPEEESDKSPIEAEDNTNREHD